MDVQLALLVSSVFVSLDGWRGGRTSWGGRGMCAVFSCSFLSFGLAFDGLLVYFHLWPHFMVSALALPAECLDV